MIILPPSFITMWASLSILMLVFRLFFEMDWGCSGRRVSMPSPSRLPHRVTLFLPFLLPLLLLPQAMAATGSSHIAVRFLEAPRALSPSSSATFRFEVAGPCTNPGCSVRCKLDSNSSANCESRDASFTSLSDGDHTFEVCINGSGVHCTSYNWTVDTVPPTAYVSAATTFTNASNISVHISFSERCAGGGGFRCFVNDCNLLVYGAGFVLPSTLRVLQPDLEFSLVVGFTADILYGRLVIVMDRSFCMDIAGNSFTRSPNSSFIVRFDRRDVFLKVRTYVPEKLLQLNGEPRTVEATNSKKDLRVYLYFSEPVLNSSSDILGILNASSGIISPTTGNNLGNRRFGYKVNNISTMAIVTITCETSSIFSRQGTPVSPPDPLTFLYDAERPSVKLSTSNMRTRERGIPVQIKFVKPVFDFSSSAITVSGGHLVSFHEVTKSMYNIHVHADDRVISVEIPENATADVAGNKNLASNRLQVRHYSVPLISSMVSAMTTVTFGVTSMAAALLTISTASLISSGAFSRPASSLASEPSRNLARIACHIQIFALSKWLTNGIPLEYYEFANGIEWSIPYLTLPWEVGSIDASLDDLTPNVGMYSEVLERHRLTPRYLPMRNKMQKDAHVPGAPLTPIEYRFFFEAQDLKPEAEFVTSGLQNRWTYFGRNMFWLAVIGGGLLVLHVAILLILKFRRRTQEQREFGALVFPRFEIFLLILALPCICQASTTIIGGRSTADIAVGILLLGIPCTLLLSLLVFLSVGISLGKLLQYKEVHQEGQEFHWYQELIRVTLGPGKKGQWTWRDQSNPIRLTQLGPLFEDLRGPPKYMLSQITSGGGDRSHEKRGGSDQIIDSEDETEDAEAPFIQKLFGILRIYYTFLESAKRISLGIVAGASCCSSASSPSKVGTLVMLSITSFQLFFIVLKKPFIKKEVQFVEIITVASEVGIFGVVLVLLETDLFSDEAAERRVGYFMLGLFVLSYATQMVNQWHALYMQVVRLAPKTKTGSLSGLKAAVIGLLLIILPKNLLTGLNVEENPSSPNQLGDGAAGVSTSQANSRSSGGSSSEKSWLRQLRELAKASFSREDHEGVNPNDPSSSRDTRSRFWSGKRSGSSSMASSSSDYKAKSDSRAKLKGLYKDLEAIFTSK